VKAQGLPPPGKGRSGAGGKERGAGAEQGPPVASGAALVFFCFAASLPCHSANSTRKAACHSPLLSNHLISLPTHPFPPSEALLKHTRPLLLCLALAISSALLFVAARLVDPL